MSFTPSNNSSTNSSSTAASWATLDSEKFLSARDALTLGQSHSHEGRSSSRTGTGSPDSRSSMDLSELKVRSCVVQSEKSTNYSRYNDILSENKPCPKCW